MCSKSRKNSWQIEAAASRSFFSLMYGNQRAKNNKGTDFRQSYIKVLATQLLLQQHIAYFIFMCKTQLFLP